MKKLKIYINEKSIAFVIILFFAFIGCDSTNTNLWPDGKIKFIPVNLDKADTQVLLESMLLWELASGGKIKFIITNDCGDGVLHIIKSQLPFNIGGITRKGYSESEFLCMNINSDYSLSECGSMIYKHELGHVIGLSDDYTNKNSIMYFKRNVSDNISISIFDVEKINELYKNN